MTEPLTESERRRLLHHMPDHFAEVERILDDRTAIANARWHRALDNPDHLSAGPIRDHIEQHDQAVRAAAIAELHDKLRAEIARTSIYHLAGLLRAAEVLEVPDAEEVTGRG